MWTIKIEKRRSEKITRVEPLKKNEKKIEKSLNEHLNYLIVDPSIHDLTNDTNLMNDMKKIYSKVKRLLQKTRTTFSSVI